MNRRHVLVLAAAAGLPVAQAADTPRIGLVLMHGKGGTPTALVSDLAAALARRGMLVANIEMPWSRSRTYDISVADAERSVDEAIRGLREQGAQKIFVGGHSLGAVFAICYGSRHPVDGVVMVAPGGSVSTKAFRERLGDSVEKARRLVAEGKGDETARLTDFEGGRGEYTIVITPKLYLEWFDPDGAISQVRASRRMNPAVPVLYVSPTGDYAGLRNSRQESFAALPPNPLTRMIEPATDHAGAPMAARQEIGDWLLEVAASR